ncbi:response regulator [Pseudosulfitobacter sp. DSM 107133]|uniref:hybrid sensor histidine kinase/response regulator n=1 Tax=Pseudosulfitobacter sp. DSM 107133 TaxID=2883100 RepID=UPI0013B3C751|nr:response regulator [Pseudosulfitobacter sp. DSM 107133]UOA29423.1 Sensory/regulatory protein RpfC [Pseudosulfitobacter sp. DSM 107133]
MPEKTQSAAHAAKVRPVLQAVARLVSTDRRAVVLATEQAEVLLSNAPASRVGLDAKGLNSAFDWAKICARARRAGSVAVSTTFKKAVLEGELVHLPLGTADGFLLRLAETDQEAALLRNRTRTATLLRVSHDLRTPIQSLLAATDAVLQGQGADGPSADERRAKMQRSAELALSHIDNVIKVIRGELTTADIQSDENFNLTEEVRATLDMIEPIASARGASLTLRLDPPEDVNVHGPVRFVRALLQNMFDNSVKHGGAAIDVQLTCSTLPATTDAAPAVAIMVEVSDQGGGLPDAQKARLLRALDQTDAAQTRQTAGANDPANGRPSAGLNVMAHALGQLGGALELLDRAANGAPIATGETAEVAGTILRARFELPPADPTAIQTPAPASDGPNGPDGLMLDGVGILVVEDSPSSRDWLVHCLGTAGASVMSVENGLRALDVLQGEGAVQEVDLMLTDMTLPHMNGVELVQRIVAGQAAGTLAWRGKMLGLTAHSDAGLRKACLDLGMAQLLEKPIRSADLCRTVHDLVRATDTAGRSAPTDSSMQKPGQGADCSATQPLAMSMIDELVDQLGIDGTRGFMRRANAEAQAVFEDMTRTGIHQDTGRMLHAATGACGLTGLKLLERSLRALELSLKAAQPVLQSQLDDLQEALASTTRAIENLGQDADAG